ncbi:MAG: hypothetical protein K2N49_02215 [Ruminococcus sp.]|nr:hypothetical protein [Ruminococcus sp.]MDE7225662.1 hypothetical protein [Ruminococcus sp.]
MKHESLTKISNLKKIFIASLCILSLSSCGEKSSEPDNNISSENTVSDENQESEIPDSSDEESPDESEEYSDTDNISDNGDLNEIPENAVLKKDRYIISNGEKELQSTEYLDESGNPVRMLSNDGSSTVVTQYQNEYDENGNLLSAKTAPYQGFESLVTYEYNDDGTVKTITHSESSAGVSESYSYMETYSYNDYGDKISMVTSLPDGGDVYGSIFFEYEYDENNRPVTEIHKDENGFVYTTIYRTYDENGNVLTEKSTYGENTDGSTKVFAYDDQNRLISSHDVSPDGTEMLFIEYEYEEL